MGSVRHQYGISALVTQTSFCEGSSGDLAKRRLFSQAKMLGVAPTCKILYLFLVLDREVKGITRFPRSSVNEKNSFGDLKRSLEKLHCCVADLYDYFIYSNSRSRTFDSTVR